MLMNEEAFLLLTIRHNEHWFTESFHQSHKKYAILDKIFVGFFTFWHIFFLPQVKRNYIIITRKKVYELPHELPNDLRF